MTKMAPISQYGKAPFSRIVFTKKDSLIIVEDLFKPCFPVTIRPPIKNILFPNSCLARVFSKRKLSPPIFNEIAL